MLEKGNYIPRESRFIRFLDNKLEEGDQMWRSIKKEPYKRPMIPNLNNNTKQILEPLFKMTKAKEGESLESVYERLTMLVDIMDRNNVRPISVSINTKFLNYLQPEWRKYVTMVHHNQTRDVVSYDELYDSLIQFEPHVLASKAKKAVKNHDLLALLAHSNAFSSQSHANSSYSPQPYYVMVEMVIGMQGDKTRIKHLMQEMGIMKAIRLFSVFHEVSQIQEIANVQCYICNEKGHYACDCQKPRVCDAKYLREQMLLAMKDEAESNLKDEENDFMLDNSYEDETLEELIAAVIMMDQIQPVDDNADSKP
uniref:CCHC-type domain-containing protein n=1 Tax=Tanacetum cinerariifolium TaxID=118510 RepID=A0A699H3R2_TANCI|nr:hypothetical protein [Tanacetum cinerariifolium]